MNPNKLWERAWKLRGYDELNPDRNIVKLVSYFKRKKFKRILDLGCGIGRHMVYLGRQGFYMVGLDISPTALKLADRWMKKEELKNYSLVKHDMVRLPFPDKSFDAVIGVHVIQHNKLYKIEKTVKEIRRVLKVNGATFITLPSTKDRKFGAGKIIEHNTYLSPHTITDAEKGQAAVHRFFDKDETKKLFSQFKTISMKEEIRDLKFKGRIKKSVHWLILCQKI